MTRTGRILIRWIFASRTIYVPDLHPQARPASLLAARMLGDRRRFIVHSVGTAHI